MSDYFLKIVNDVYRLTKDNTPDDLELKLKNLALKSTRKQSRVCLHDKDESIVQMMYICHLKDCNVKIHKHLDFPEWILFIKAKARLIYFNDNGEKLKTIKIDTYKSNGSIIQSIPKNKFHTIKFDEDSFFLEIKQGPFNKTNTEYL